MTFQKSFLGEKMKKNIFCLFIILTCFCLVSVLAQDTTVNKRTLAILYFDNNSLAKKQEMEPLRKGLADMFITEFSKINQFQVIERANLQQIFEEMKLGQSGALDNSTAQQVGKMLGAQNLILGSFMLMLDGKLRIDLRLVETETGITLKAEEETGSPKELSTMVDNLLKKSLSNMNVKLSQDENQSLKEKDNKNFDAALYYARGLEYEDAKDYVNARKMYMMAIKASPKYMRARVRLKSIADK